MKRRHILISFTAALVLVAVILIFVLPGSPVKKHKPPVKASVTTTHSQSATTQTPKGGQAKTLNHVFIIVDENQPSANIIGNPSAPYLNSLIKQYALATNYSAVAHPSLPNYLALTSGSTDGITTDCNPPSAGCEVNVKNIADEIQSSGRTWKEYAESMPSNCYAYNSGLYATKHNPFLYYSDIINNPSRCQSHVVPFSQMAIDLRSVQTTPNYAFITPNLCNDMHNCSIATGDAWLAQNVPTILQSKAFTTQNSLLVITWDEGYVGDNHVAAVLAGSAIKNGYSSASPYTHYSILRTIEASWGLSPLTNNDSSAPSMSTFLK